jgi:hypothetical protein
MELRALQSLLRAYLVFGRQYGSDVRESLDEVLNEIPRLTDRELDAQIVQSRGNLDSFVEHFGPMLPPAEFERRYRNACAASADFMFIHKWELCSMFSKVQHVLPWMRRLPEHTRISLDVHGRYPADSPGEVRILEAAIFEDMCAQLNAAMALIPKVLSRSASKVEQKSAASFRRGAVLGAFYLVESYLNSIAFDHLVNHADRLSQTDIDRLTEWDSGKGRGRFVSFREKLLSYPRLVTGAAGPPLQENNCEEISFLLEEAKGFRDAIVHASPHPTRATSEFDKEARFWQLGESRPFWYYSEEDISALQTQPSDLWVEIVDKSIRLLEKLETVIHGSTTRLFWLHRRGTDGCFAAVVFD